MDCLYRSIHHLTDYLQHHRATATGHYSNDKAELWIACMGVFLTWLSAASQSNSHWALPQWQGWVVDCLYRNIPRLTDYLQYHRATATGHYSNDKAELWIACAGVFLSGLSATSQSNSHWALQQWQGWAVDCLYRSIPHLTDYLQHHRATATGHYSIDKVK